MRRTLPDNAALRSAFEAASVAAARRSWTDCDQRPSLRRTSRGVAVACAHSPAFSTPARRALSASRRAISCLRRSSSLALCRSSLAN